MQKPAELTENVTTDRWTKLFWCSACNPAAMSQPKFNSRPWLSNHSKLDCWQRRYVFRSPYTHTHKQRYPLDTTRQTVAAFCRAVRFNWRCLRTVVCILYTGHVTNQEVTQRTINTINAQSLLSLRWDVYVYLVTLLRWTQYRIICMLSEQPSTVCQRTGSDVRLI